MKKAVWGLLAAVLLTGGLAGCASIPKEYAEVEGLPDINKCKVGQGFIIVDEIAVDYAGFYSKKIGRSIKHEYFFSSSFSNVSINWERFGDTREIAEARVEPGKTYRFYYSVYRDKYVSGFEKKFRLDKIEGLMPLEEAQVKLEQKKAAEAAAEEAKRNPKNLNYSLYTKTTVEEFTFDMSAGKLAAGTKVTFLAKFLIKPTGTNYVFQDISPLITLSTNYNFVKDIPAINFQGETRDTIFFGLRYYEQEPVRLYVTVIKPGQTGECSVDIVWW